jgi:parvulin-like peptidyl-prolyl isomerase
MGTVDGMPIGTLEFDSMAARQMGRDGTLDDELRAEIVDRLVDEKLLYLEALRRGIDKDPKIQKMMVNTLLKQEVYSQVRTSEISEDELRAYFETNKEDFVVPEKVQIKRILIKIEDGEEPAAARARAEEILAAVKANPSDFKTLAQRHSKGPYARRGGDVGFVTPAGKPGVDPAVVTHAFSVEGQDVLDEVFETVDGFNIIYIPNRRARVERTFQQMRGSVLRKVKADKYKTLYEDYVGGLRGKAVIELDDAMISSYVIVSGRSRSAGGSATGGTLSRRIVTDTDPAEGTDPEAESDGSPE